MFSFITSLLPILTPAVRNPYAEEYSDQERATLPELPKAPKGFRYDYNGNLHPANY